MPRLPPAEPLAVMMMLRLPFTAANWPAATVHACALLASQLASGGQLTPAPGVTDSTATLAGRISVRVTRPRLARLPVFVAVMVQVIVSPTLAVVLSASFVTRMMGPGTVAMAVFGKSFATSTEVVATLDVTVDRLSAGCV